MYKKIFLVVLLVLLLFNFKKLVIVSHFFNEIMPGRGFTNYWQKVADASNAHISDLKCKQPWGSREGFCTFTASQGDIQKIVGTFKLVSNPQGWPLNVGCKSAGFQGSQMQIFKETEPILKEPFNTHSYFRMLFYNDQSNPAKACVELYYPYG